MTEILNPAENPAGDVLLVALPLPLRRAFEYLVPNKGSNEATPGSRVLVPLGHRCLVGVVLARQAATVPKESLRKIIDVLDSSPSLPSTVLSLCQWVADYYHAPIGEVLHNALPVLLRQSRPRRRPKIWTATAESYGLGEGALSRAPKQAEALAMLKRHGPVSTATLLAAGTSRATLLALRNRGLICEDTALDDPNKKPESNDLRPKKPKLPLNAEQQHVISALSGNLDHFSCNLLEGVTGSGKTEIYLQLISEVVNSGRAALVLIPEIGLAPQTRQRFEERFGSGVGVLHSGLNDSARLEIWKLAGAGYLKVLIGTRSAVFTPIPQLGLIVVDEEHDLSFKQQEGVRYSARDVAIYRARQADVPVVLGSATPSAESLSHAMTGRYGHHRLFQRAGPARMPRKILLDIRRLALEGGMSAELLEQIAAEVDQENQVMVFLNRRGWAPVLMCHDCGWSARCSACDARLTLHREADCLWCHYCDRRRSVPHTCLGCRSRKLVALGEGTERCEHLLTNHFPGVPVYRIDRGTARRTNSFDTLGRLLQEQKPAILIGTQMLAKGHHFERVTLVAVLDIDRGLFAPDIRAIERTGQLLEQVSGRAGRARLPGRVLIQTHHPDHPALRAVIRDGYGQLIRQILRDRHRSHLPPYSHLALLGFDSVNGDDGPHWLARLRKDLLRTHPRTSLIGPIPAPMRRRAGKYRDQLLYRSAHRKELHSALDTTTVLLERWKLPSRCRWFIDVDPLEGI